MKYYGDIPVEHLETVNELRFLEELVEKHSKDFPVLQLAKGFVGLALDYYTMEMEEEGDRLILKAEKLAPGYFKGPIISDVNKDYEFAIVVEHLRHTMGYDLMKTLGFDE